MLKLVSRNVRLAAPATCCAALALSVLVWHGPPAAAQGTETAPSSAASSAKKAGGSKQPGASSRAATDAVIHPTWNELTAAQRETLKPLKGSWNELDDARKRKWLAISQNYAKLSETEQTKLQERMTEWAALSAKQRTRARLGFAETKELTPEQKEERWQAYQALSIDEKRALARSAVKTPAGAAAAIKPVPAHKLAVNPATAPASHAGAALPPKDPARHVLGSASMPRVNSNTLLPKPAASVAKNP